MRILLTHERFAPDFAGGGEYVALETARSLIAQGIDVRVLTTGDPRSTECEGVPTMRLPMHRYRFNFATRQIAVAAADVDLIYTFNYHACLPSLCAGRRAGKPVVCMTLGLFGDAWKAMRGRIVGLAWMAWERFLLTRSFDRTLFLSDYSREQGVALGVPPNRALVNRPGIELSDYGPAVPKDDTVLFVGKLDVRKGVDDLLNAARAVPDVQFRIMGWGERESSLRREAPANVEFVQFERGEKLQAAFAAAKVFVLPSRAETFGIAIIEAMASGCVIVSTIPLEYEGVRLQTGTADEIVAAVRGLLSAPGVIEHMGRRNICLAQGYTWRRHAQWLISLFEELLNPDVQPPAAGSMHDSSS
ncbi:MAG: glycosyltransferase family 4 protein [bacterium]|nr:glycosyltransferase family 4 protein [bacterium]